VVVYPDRHERNGNDCRKAAAYPARKLRIDDAGLVFALVERLQSAIGADPARVFAIGYSNGGHLAFRLAWEHPERVTAVAAFAAKLLTDDNSHCKATGKSVPIMIVNGTSDAINPYDGGVVILFGFGNRGTVRSARSTAEYFADLNGLSMPNVTRVQGGGPTDGT
jgi:polyhydroxybutyrate depolymerase